MKSNEHKTNWHWYYNGGEKQIEENIEDENGVFSTPIGSEAGIYVVLISTPAGQKIPMYVGEVGKAFNEGLVDHFRYWLTNPKWYTGLRLSELEIGYKFVIRVLELESDKERRQRLKESFIEEYKPYLQFNCYPKFKSEYHGYDLAIFPEYRRRAFIVARDGKYTEEENACFVDNIFKIPEEVDFNNYRTVIPDQSLVELIKQEMPNGSDICRAIKQFVERRMGITSIRGCRYSFLVKIVAAVLETKYKEEYSL